MTKTPDEIKKGLECCWGSRAETGLVGCDQCPYWGKYGCPAGKVKLGNDALALIQHKEQENAQQAETIERLNDGCHKLIVKIQQLEAERDALQKELETVESPCDFCKHLDKEGSEDPCNRCKHILKGRKSRFEWRGVQKD